MELDRTERRIQGSLLEKKLATPEQYPLSLKALVAACNQRSNRQPVLALEEFEVEGALLALRERGLVYTVERDGGRVIRYSERLAEELRQDRLGSAILAELLLRGPQTSKELSRRLPRLGCAEGPELVEEKLRDLARGRVARLLPRQVGQRHARWTHLLCPEGEVQDPDTPAPEAARRPVRDEIAALGEEVADLRRRLERLEARAKGGSPTSTPPSP